MSASVGRIEVAAASTVKVALPDFSTLYEEHFELAWRVARRLGVPEASADDVVQDVFLVLHRRLSEYDGQTPARRWILGMTVRVVSDYRRRHRRKEARWTPEPEDAEGDVLLASSEPSPSAALEQREQVRLLERLLHQLSEDKRDVLVLAELEELTVPEIAALLGANENTIYTRLRTARRDFEKLYERYQRRSP